MHSPCAGSVHRKCFLELHEYLQQTNVKSSHKRVFILKVLAPSISQRIATIAGGVSDNSQHIFNFDCLTNSFSECYSSNEHVGENLNLYMIILRTAEEPESAGEIVGND